MEDIPITKVLSIAECGHDEAWLRDMIYDDPSILGLGDLQPVMKEKKQSQGGCLDLLLNNPEDDSMFEVELQLGRTDESHIIRTIEYWDNEKKKWPKRSHTAVLVAEQITSRFFNVVHLLSTAVPIIGIRANMVQVGDAKALHFTKIIDSYEEPEKPTQQTYDEKHWLDKYPGSLQCATWYRELLGKYYGDIPIKYFETYLSLTVGGIARVWVDKRKNDRAWLTIKYAKEGIVEATDHLRKEGVPFSVSDEYLKFNVSLRELKERQPVHDWVARRIAPQFLQSEGQGQNPS